ncbi:hypothetical protein AB0K80_01305 [Streptomyces sp. NPDC052682]|uniref:hypothetical protein n=1 Tax=Streptomyces sp. NPDC052682 TaxID=3154954 RepID=UPI003426E603
MTARSLDAVPWDRLESALPQHPVSEVPRVLRRLALGGAEAGEEDTYPLFSCLAAGNGRVPSAATAALPFLVALAADPGQAQRLALVDLLVALHQEAATAAPHLVDEGWPAAWRRHRPAIRALLADPDPRVRREALPLAEGAADLLDRWRAEPDPTVRLPLLLHLGRAAAGARDDVRAGVRAVLAGVLRDGDPVLRVAAVFAWAHLDPGMPVRRLDTLVDALAEEHDFAAVWYMPGVEHGYSRTDLVPWLAGLLRHDTPAATSLVLRLAGAAHRALDTALHRAALTEAWRLLVRRPSTAPALLPVAGALLADPDSSVRLKAAHLLAVLGRRAAPYADRLAELADDPGEDDVDYLEGTVGDYARWALARIGDPRALPGLVERLYAPYREHYGRGYCAGDPRLPELDEVLAPLRSHADVLLPPLREVMRQHAAHYGGAGPLTGAFLRVLRAWGGRAVAALPEVVPLLADPAVSLSAVQALAAMGPAAASAEPAVRGCAVLDQPRNRQTVAWAAWRLGGDRERALRLIGDAVLTDKAPFYGPLHLLADFGPAAAPYAGRVRHIMEHAEGEPRLRAAAALWAITGEPEPSVPVLAEFVLPMADGDDRYGLFADALRALARIGVLTPAARAALRTLRDRDRRLSPGPDYRAILLDEELRALTDDLLGERRSAPGPTPFT